MQTDSASIARGKVGSAKVAALNADFARSLSGAASRARVSTFVAEQSGSGLASDLLPSREDPTEQLRDTADRPKRVGDPDTTSAREQADEDVRNERTSEDAEAAEKATVTQSGLSIAGATTVAADPGTLLTRQPLTIETLNSVILLGGQSPRFSLVAPDQRPGAELTKPASEGVPEQAHRDAAGVSRPREPSGSGTDAHTHRESPSSLPKDDASSEHAHVPAQSSSSRENKAEVRSSSDNSAAVNRPSTAPRKTNANISVHAAPIVVAGAATTRPTPSTDSRGAAPSGSISGSSTSKFLERLDPSSSTRATAPAQKTDQDFERQLALQLQRGVTEALRSPGGTLTLRLQPAHLGQLRVQVKIDADQNLRARFEVASAKTRAALSGSMAELVSALSDKGVHVEDIAVTLRPRLPDRDLGLPPLRTEREDGMPTSAPPDDAQVLPSDAGPSFARDPEQAVGAESGGAHSDQSSQRRSSQDAGLVGAAAVNDISTPPAEPALDLFPIDASIGQTVGIIGSVLHVAQDGRVRVDATA